MADPDSGMIVPQPACYSGFAPGAPETDAILYEERDNIAFITINRAPHNRFDEVVTNALHDAWLRFSLGDARVALLVAEGTEAFCGGAASWERSLDVWWSFPGVGVPLEKPVVAAVAGIANGTGLGLITFCDIVVAAEAASFCYPEAKYAVAGGMAASLAARLPQKIASEILIVGDSIDARRAYEAGLVNKVVPLGQEREAALAYARTIAANGPRCVRMMKRFIDDTIPKSPPELAAIARRQINDTVFSQDRAEAMSAMMEGRKPVFTGD